jgi:hypothetical protein
MQTHSPEPWLLSGDPMACRHHVTAITDAMGDYPLTLEPGDWTLSDSDARRIVACINACRGIPTELLEMGYGPREDPEGL